MIPLEVLDYVRRLDAMLGVYDPSVPYSPPGDRVVVRGSRNPAYVVEQRVIDPDGKIRIVIPDRR